MAVGVGALASCSSDGPTPAAASPVPEGGGVGAKCSANSQCTGYARPSCVTNVKPLAGLVDASVPQNRPLVDFHVPFPGGYCSNTVADSCTSDADCGAGAGCFRPFGGVSQMTIDSLNKLGALPFDVNDLTTFALCLKPCTSPADCRTDEGYGCDIPLNAVMATIDKNYDRKFCFVSVDDQIRGLLGSSDAGP